MPRHFVSQWLLSYVLTAILWTAISAFFRSATTPLSANLVLVIGFWGTVGVAQAPIWESLVWRRWAWGALTALGGTMGLLSVLLHSRGQFFVFLSPTSLRIIGADGIWLMLVGLLAGAILGFCQMWILQVRLPLRFWWLIGSSVGAAAAFFAADAAFELLFWEWARDLLVAGRRDLIANIRTPTRILLGSPVFALVTGFVGNRIRQRHHRRKQEEMLGQFD